ncbi:hypothetical protein BJF90_11505, partial [Pseudonocardia sp. CNS-004]
MSDIRWEGLSHDEIYATVHQGPGAAVSRPAEDAWKQTEALILRVDQRIASAMAASQAGWEGGGAEATRTAMTPLGQWALDAARNAKLTAGAVTGQGLYAKFVRDNMPEPVTEQRNAAIGNALTDPTFIFHGLDDLQAVEQDAANRAARAVELMNTYTENSEGNRQFWGPTPFPPQVTVVADTGAPGSAGPGALGAPHAGSDAAGEVAPPPPGGATPVPPSAPLPPPGVTPPPGSPPVPPAARRPVGRVPGRRWPRRFRLRSFLRCRVRSCRGGSRRGRCRTSPSRHRRRPRAAHPPPRAAPLPRSSLPARVSCRLRGPTR